MEAPSQYISPLHPGPLKTGRCSLQKYFYGSGTILIVDDEQPVLEAASEMLNIWIQGAAGFHRRGSTFNLQEKRDTIDLVILDMIMPVMGGSQVLKALREINPDVRIILSSGYVMRERGESH